VKFAVKEIKYKEKMEIDSTTASSLDLNKDIIQDDYEEYEEVEAIM